MSIRFVRASNLLGTWRIGKMICNSSKMHAPHWTCIALCNIHGKMRLIPGRGHVCYRLWDMQSTLSELGCVGIGACEKSCMDYLFPRL